MKLSDEKGLSHGAESAKGADASDCGWLVELQSDGKFRGWISGNEGTSHGWTTDPNLAIRFCRREDADAFRRRFGFMGTARSCTHLSTEHVWLARASPIKAEVTTGEAVRRFACFTMEDGVYESATGEHVAYSDYESLARERDRADNTLADINDALRTILADDIQGMERERIEDIAFERDHYRAANASLRAKLDERDANAERFRYLNALAAKAVQAIFFNHSKSRDRIKTIDAARQSAQAASQPEGKS